MDSPTLPPLSRLKPFEAAARHESFSRAAAELGMTQTAISKQIALLEHELGTALFERRNRAVFLTDAGRRLGRVVSAALAEIVAEVARLSGQRRAGEVILHCQLCEAFYWLMPRLARFHGRHPDVELRVISTLKPLTETTEQFDVAIQTTGRPSGTARLVGTASDDIFPVCAPSLIQGHAWPLPVTDLAAFPLLSHMVVPQDWMEWQDWFIAVGAVLPPAHPRLVAMDSYPLALQAAVAGQGIALGWQRTTEGMIAEEKLIRPCAEYVSRPTELSIYRSTARDRHPDTEKLLSWISDELSA
ncbi:LysR family transcriptional regulator [Actibacterium sp. 188UL27-1]|uniref:LysR family transcriptional regulator n=1 Tax=Actibacterium sp. 188UL27-1 TaxID=2786961 RepID=UPI00195BAB32|nr:LysR family transcriptional regulator [Actibacterium sp. 188UL27-1]MBM7067928.1 LysR family transcriptional regulator [Actibacterium sp. 188UL27-1]